MAISILAAAILTTACSGQATTPSVSPTAASSLAASPTIAATSSLEMSPVPLPGGRLVYAQWIEEETGSLFTTNPDGTNTTPLLPVGNPQRWSPDGRHISVVAENSDGRLFVGLIDPDGSHYVQFDSPDPTLDLGGFAWSPDGSRLACEGWDDTDLTRNGMYTVRASDGGDLVRVTTCPNSCHDIPTDYSPDGAKIVFTRQRLPDEADATLMVVNVDGSGARALTDRKLGGGRLSPDGKTILTDSEGSLLLVTIDGGEIRTIEISVGGLETAFSGSWSPDGEWIVFSGRASKSVDLYIVRVDGTQLHQVTDTPIGKYEDAADWTAAAP
jgi:Tol biopolymer transport system component